MLNFPSGESLKIIFISSESPAYENKENNYKGTILS
jgi:hypothetical protein